MKISISKDATNGERSVVIKGGESDVQRARARIEQIIVTTPSRPAHRESDGTAADHVRDSDIPSSVEGGYGYALDPYASGLGVDYGGSYGDSLPYSVDTRTNEPTNAYEQWDSDILRESSNLDHHA